MQKACFYSRHRYSTVSAFEHLFPTPKPNANADPPSPSPPRNTLEAAQSISHLINTQPWSPPLLSSLSSFSPLSEPLVLRTLRLIHNSSSALRFFNYAQNNGFHHPIHSYNLLLRRLCQTRNLDAAQTFIFSIPARSNGTVTLQDKHFNTLIRSYGEAGMFVDSFKLFQRMKKIGVSPSVYTFTALFLILLKRGRVEMVFELYDEMLKTYGVKPDLYSFNILIRGFCKNKMVDRGYGFFKEMEKYGCVADVVTYNTILDGLCRDGRLEIARNVFKGMAKKGKDVSPNVVTYTTLIGGYCRKQQIDEAWAVFEEMTARGVMPNEVTCNTLIQGLCEAHKLDEVKEVLEKSKGFVPDTCTFTILMKAHCDVGNLDEARKVFDNMTLLNVKKDSASYSVLIRYFCKEGSFERAEELCDELLGKEILLREDGCTPLVAAYNPVFKYLCKGGKTRKADKLFRQLMRRGTQDALAFEILIMGHCLEGAPGAGYELLVLMRRSKFVPPLHICESLIDGLLKNSEFIPAYDTLERMLKDSYRVKTFTCHFVLSGLHKNGYAHEAADLMTLMLEKKIRPTLSLSTDTLKVLFKNGLGVRGIETYKHIHDSGYTVNMEELVPFLCQEWMLIDAYELLLHSIEKDQTANVDLCSMVITGLCKISRVSEAFKLYYEVIELGKPEKLSCLKELISALQDEGKLSEAKFVAKRMVK